MTIEGVIFDVSNTLVNAQGVAVAGVIDAIDRLRAGKVQVIAVQNSWNRKDVVSGLTRAGVTVDHVITRTEIPNGTAKGSPLWIQRACRDSGLASNQLLYVGDSDLDMRTAVHGNVIYFHACWVTPIHTYGLSAHAPAFIPIIVEHIFRKQHPWAWHLDIVSTEGVRIRQMALIDGNGARDETLKNDLISLAKSTSSRMVGMIPMTEFILLHFLASIYAEKLHEETDFWTTFPSQDGTRAPFLTSLLDRSAKLFRDKYQSQLLIRHTPARLKSNTAFHSSGENIYAAITNQLDSLAVNETTSNIEGKNILLLDDFITRGPTLGIGRLFLRSAGAHEVFGVAIGKYGPTIHIIEPPESLPAHWERSRPLPFTATQCRVYERRIEFNQAALQEFLASYRAIKAARW